MTGTNSILSTATATNDDDSVNNRNNYTCTVNLAVIILCHLFFLKIYWHTAPTDVSRYSKANRPWTAALGDLGDDVRSGSECPKYKPIVPCLHVNENKMYQRVIHFDETLRDGES